MRQKADLLVELSLDLIRKRAGKAVVIRTLVETIMISQIVIAFGSPTLAMPSASQMHQLTNQKSAKGKRKRSLLIKGQCGHA